MFPVMASSFVEPRDITIWLPDNYDRTLCDFPVVYLHDGQRLHDDAGLATAFRHRADDQVVALAYAAMAWPAIVVAIDSSDRHRAELRPPTTSADAPEAEAYLRFIVHELKPAIDSSFRTRHGPAHTVMMGSGAAGLLSLYAIARCPHIFGGAACLYATSGEDERSSDDARRRAIERLLRQVPIAGRHRLYLDFDGEGRDLACAPFIAAVNRTALRKGYRAGRDMLCGSGYALELGRQPPNVRADLALTMLLKSNRPRPEGEFD